MNAVNKSVSTRYFYSTAFLLLCSIALMGFIQIYLSMGYFREEKDKALITTIDNAVRIFQEYEANGESIEDDVTIVNVSREIYITARASGNLIFVTDAYGSTILCNDTDMSVNYLTKQFPAKALSAAYLNDQFTDLGTLGGFFSKRYYVAGKPLLSENDKLAGFIFAASDASGLTMYLSNMFSTFILSAGLMLMISSVLSIWLTARMTTPLRRMADAASRFGKGDFTVRVPEEGDDEVCQLSHNFNSMAESLQKIDSSRSSFMGNIAHELRTPMTTIKGFVDGMLDGTIPPESHDHYLGVVSEEAGRLTRLIKNMLDITKLESGEYKVNAKNYDVWESVTGVVFGAEQRIEANHIQLTGFAPVRTLVHADPDLVYQVTYNLFDNALKFCGTGGEIRLSVTQKKDMVTVSVRNTGQGIAPEALPYVFERFYKEDKSRGLNAMGSGLGLHICKVLIGLSGGHIWAESEYGQSCTFAFTLPAAPPKDTRVVGKRDEAKEPRDSKDARDSQYSREHQEDRESMEEHYGQTTKPEPALPESAGH